MKNIYSNTAHREDKTDSMKYKKFFSGKWLTPYALCCGYLESISFQKEIPSFQDIILTLGHNSGIGYDVRAYNHSTHTRLYWETFTKLSEARKQFMVLKREILKGVVS